MKICVWKAADDVPTAHAYLARFLTKDGFTPVFVTAKTEEDVRRKAQAFWDKELVRLAPGKKGRKGVSGADTPAADDVGNADVVAQANDASRRVAEADDPDLERDGVREELGLPTTDDLCDLLG